MRRLCPQGSPGKNTGVDFHALLRGVLLRPGKEPTAPAVQATPLPLSRQGRRLKHVTPSFLVVMAKGT